MNEQRILEIGLEIGKMLLESGAEVYRVEDTMNRVCSSFLEVKNVDSYVMSTGIVLSMEIDGKTVSRVCRVKNRSINLECIERVNGLSRELQTKKYTLDEIEEKLEDIKNKPKFPNWMLIVFGAIGASAFAMFFQGGIKEIIISFVIGFVVRLCLLLFTYIDMNDVLKNIISSTVIGILSYAFSQWSHANMDILIISGIMLLIPGLAITNAIRDTMSGDYISGLSRGMEALMTACSIAIGVGVVLGVVM